MPEVSRFFGMRIAIYYNEHNPPHFHVYYQAFDASYSIESGKRIKGKLPVNLEKIIVKWSKKNRTELLNNWNLAKNKRPLTKIKGEN